MNIFVLGLKMNGFPISKAKNQLKKIKLVDFKNFKLNQDKKKWKIFKYHHVNNSYYKNLVGNVQIIVWEDIPILTKNSIQVPMDKIITKGFDLNDVYINNTSGSTGIPFFFAKDKFSHAMTWALIFERFKRHGIIYGQSKQARFYGIPKSGIGYYKEKIKDLIANRVRFPVFDLSDMVLSKFLKVFKSVKFEYINGYTSSLVMFAKFLIRKEICLVEYCPTLKKCFTTSEMCNELDRICLEKGFGVKVVNEYGAAELDLISFEDEDGDWIISDENIYLEIVDEEGKSLPNGKTGRIIVTSLHNKAMPFIRYDLGDIGSISNSKKGNNSILLSLIGRTNDIAELPSGKKSPGLTFYYISKKVLENSGFLNEFVIRQLALDAFHFEYVSDREISKKEIIFLQKAMDEYLEPNLKLSFERKDIIKRTNAGKLKHFQKMF